MRVEGNISLEERLILEKAAYCGIRFGAVRSEVRSERVKNQLLQMIPQLKWAGINTSGCVAVISVRERESEEREVRQTKPGNLIAVRDGVIQSVTVLRGTGVCKVGQAVKKGEILISGYTDCGTHIRAEAAEGEVYGQTKRDLEAVFPNQRVQKGEILKQETKYALVIGKKRINLYKDSGILGTTCDKMYVYWYVTLPGGFQLPVALVREQWTCYETSVITVEPDAQSNQLETFSREYVLSQMVAGKILSSRQTVRHDSGASVITASYTCSEMLGQILYEERIQKNGENN